MKYIILITGLIFVLISLASIIEYIPIYSDLSEYEEGIVWGKLLTLIIGFLLIFVGFRIKKAHSQD